MGKKYRAVLAGCGGMAQAWVDAAKQVPEMEWVGCVDIRREAAVAFTEKCGISPESAGTDLKTLIKRTSPDFVVDVSIPAAHKPITLAALSQGCHVLGEKPLSDSIPNARKMVAAAKKARRMYMVSQNYRWNPQVRAIRKAVAEGLIGEVTTVNVDFYLGVHFGGFREQMEHPLVLDMSIHHFDLVRCTTQSDPRFVYCLEFNPKGSWYKGDVATTTVFEMSQGLVFTYRGSWCAEGPQTSWNGQWRIIGTQGTILWDGNSPPQAHVLIPKGEFVNPCEVRELAPVDEGPAGQHGSIVRFLEALRTGRKPETDCVDNIKSLGMVFGAVKSASTRKRLKIGA
ncbi:MAG: Gfo/Idh/MocA family oxidoreductase [Verrucomicrobiae bacterium]|nr:Gfo/Idh/MocA family oxidoreductase [Verrucomicrobiae bacterium]